MFVAVSLRHPSQEPLPKGNSTVDLLVLTSLDQLLLIFQNIIQYCNFTSMEVSCIELSYQLVLSAQA